MKDNRTTGRVNARPPKTGDELRDQALQKLQKRHPELVRRIQRAFLQVLLRNGEATTDAVRLLVPLGDANPKIVGAAILPLAHVYGLITPAGRSELSRRPEAHCRRLPVWKVRDLRAARGWLAAHPELKGVIA